MMIEQTFLHRVVAGRSAARDWVWRDWGVLRGERGERYSLEHPFYVRRKEYAERLF
jgi:hypothetical protein